MRRSSIAGLVLATLATACSTESVRTQSSPLADPYPVYLYGPDNDELEAWVTPHVDEFEFFLGTVDLEGRQYLLQFAISADSTQFQLAEIGADNRIDAVSAGEHGSMIVTIAGVASHFENDELISGPPLPETHEAGALLIAFDITEELEWVDDEDAAATEGDEAAYNGRKGKRKGKPKIDPKPKKGKTKTNPTGPGRAPKVAAGAAVASVLVALCIGSENTCQGAQTFHCPDGSTVQDPCGCGVSVCNKCFGTCQDECVPGAVKCPEAQPTSPTTPGGTSEPGRTGGTTGGTTGDTTGGTTGGTVTPSGGN